MTSIVKVRIKNPAVAIYASIPNEAAEELALKSGQDGIAIIKASEVIIGTAK